ncbi:lipopolysaccharide biosynthesis protein [Photobacterium lucens]|uniref:lipopolysaccharide biosynthesis protein n=1 Tax=Photobacterium lucens TaxID=2562949 RepID=UPI0013721F81|nr:oligosaccharide flippase family protein [Photobacterium lucens]MBP2699733.1 oligosaccharide flippase family protein [Vibrio parahaemolyticus]MZG57407.1 polysaccharide biosynthesis family protein [Photobacterium lucens]MZG79884.1 polysaccharide biosynthesis family protein [Photobacterium lucens]
MKTFKVVAIYGIGLVFCKLIGLALQPYVTSQLGLENYGKLDVLLVLTTLLSLLITLGVIDGVYRFYHDDSQPERLLGQALWQVSLCGLILTSLLLFLSPLLQTLLPGPPPLFAFNCFIYTIFLNALNAIPLAKLRIDDNATRFITVQVIIALVQAGLILSLVRTWGVNGIAFAGLLAQLIGSVLLYQQWPKPSLSLNVTLLKYGVILTISGLLGFISLGAERWAIAHYLGVDAVSPYAIAMQWGVAASLFIEPFSLWWFPKRFSLVNSEEQKQQLANITILACQLCILVAAAIILCGPSFLRFWLEPAFHYSSILIPFIALWLMLKGCCTFLNVGCYYHEHGKGILMINSLSTLLSLLVFIFILPMFDILVLIYCGISIQALRLVIFYLYSQYHLPLSYPLPSLFLSFALICLLCFCQQYQLTFLLMILTALLCFQVYWPWRHYCHYRDVLRGLQP